MSSDWNEEEEEGLDEDKNKDQNHPQFLSNDDQNSETT